MAGASESAISFRVPDWVRDQDRPHCPLCGEHFSLFVRRHHCRLCGDVFCHDCSRASAIVPFLHNDSKPVRVCAVCNNVVIHRRHDPRIRQMDAATQRNIAAAVDAYQHASGAGNDAVEGRDGVGRSGSASSGQTPRAASQHALGANVSRDVLDPSRYGPSVSSAAVDLWWLGTRKRIPISSCQWGSTCELKDVPIAAAIDIELQFRFPKRMAGMTHFDLESLGKSVQEFVDENKASQIVSTGRRQPRRMRLPVMKISNGHSRALLGHILLQPLMASTVRSGGASPSRLGSCSHNTFALVHALVAGIMKCIMAVALITLFSQGMPWLMGRGYGGSMIDRDGGLPLLVRSSLTDSVSYLNFASSNRDRRAVEVAIFLSAVIILINFIYSATREKSGNSGLCKRILQFALSRKLSSSSPAPSSSNKGSEEGSTVYSSVSFMLVGFEHHQTVSPHFGRDSSPPPPPPYDAVPRELRTAVDNVVDSFKRECRECAVSAKWKPLPPRSSAGGTDPTSKDLINMHAPFPSTKSTCIVRAPPRAVFKALNEIGDAYDPLGSATLAARLYNPRKNRTSSNLSTTPGLHMAYRKVLNKFDGHTAVQQLVYTVGRIPERPAQEEGFTPIANEVARPREFINVTHWRVLNEDSGSVVMVSFGTDTFDAYARANITLPSDRAQATLSEANYLESEDEEYSSGDDVPKDTVSSAQTTSSRGSASDAVNTVNRSSHKRYVSPPAVHYPLRGESYCGWMLQPCDEGRHTRLTRLSVVDAKLVTPTFLANSILGAQSSSQQINALRAYVEERLRSDPSWLATVLSAGPLHNLRGSGRKEESKTVEDQSSEAMDEAKDTGDMSPLQRCIEEKIALLEELCIVTGSSKRWQPLFEKDGLIAEMINDGGAFVTVRGRLQMPYPPQAILNMIRVTGQMDDPRSKRKDPSLKDTFVVRRIDKYTIIKYLALNGVAFVSGRDFCNIVHCRPHDTIEDGLKFVAFSREDSDCPEVSGLVRADLIIGGYLLLPVRDENGDITATDVTYCISTDAKGNIPAWILTMKAKEQPQGLLTLKTLITEEAEAEPGGVDAYCERFDFPYEGL